MEEDPPNEATLDPSQPPRSSSPAALPIIVLLITLPPTKQSLCCCCCCCKRVDGLRYSGLGSFVLNVRRSVM